MINPRRTTPRRNRADMSDSVEYPENTGDKSVEMRQSTSKVTGPRTQEQAHRDINKDTKLQSVMKIEEEREMTRRHEKSRKPEAEEPSLF
jgi:hypothetical protein